MTHLYINRVLFHTLFMGSNEHSFFRFGPVHNRETLLGYSLYADQSVDNPGILLDAQVFRNAPTDNGTNWVGGDLVHNLDVGTFLLPKQDFFDLNIPLVVDGPEFRYLGVHIHTFGVSGSLVGGVFFNLDRPVIHQFIEPLKATGPTLVPPRRDDPIREPIFSFEDL